MQKGSRRAGYHERRAALLDRMAVRLMGRDPPHPSLRQLAEAAGVTVPTLRHYFGTRTEVVRAIFERNLERGRPRLEAVAQPHGDFADSMRQFATSLIEAVAAPRPVRLGDLFAVSMAEGLLDEDLGVAALDHVIDPSVDALRRRLEAHIQRGEMRACDTRAAALMLLSPLLVAVLHQNQMGGCKSNPADLHALAKEICTAFIAAYAASPEGNAP